MHVIATTEELAKVCDRFSEAPYVTVDTEFLRERTYWPKLCLVQLARPGDNGDEDAVLIDPLAEDMDTAPLLELMVRSNVVKVFHAARQDIEIFHHLSGQIPFPLADTQVMAMVCGYGEQVGYETIVRQIVKTEIDKSSRFTDWSRRPLSGRQIRYALADVTFLRQVYEMLGAEIVSSGRAHWVEEEMAILTNPGTYANDPDMMWTRIKTRSGDPKFLAVVRSLASWRERTAQKRNIPRSWVLKDDALIEIASAKPATPKEFSRLRLARRDVRKPEITAEILTAVAKGANSPKEGLPGLPVPPRRREGSAAVAEMLRVFLKARSGRLKVAAKLIASSADLDALAGEEAPDIPLLKGWRRKVFGEDALRIRSGEIGLAAGPNGIEVIELGTRLENRVQKRN